MVAIRGVVDVVKQHPCQYSAKEHQLALKTDWRWTLPLSVDADTAISSPSLLIQCGGGIVSEWSMVLSIRTRIDFFFHVINRTVDDSVPKAHVQWSMGDGVESDSHDDYDDAPFKFASGYERDYCCHGAIQRDQLFKNCVKNDQLVVTGSITIYHSHDREYPRLVQELQFLKQTASTLFEEELGNFTVRCSDGGKDVRVSKKLLADKSPVLAQMLASGMKEATKDELVIEDFDFATVHSMVKFLHIGQLSADMDATKLLAMAEKYQIDRLKQLCSDSLVSTVSLDSACHLLVLGEMHNAAELKKAAMDLICADPPAAMATDGWKEYFGCNISKLNVSLLNELFAVVGKKAVEGGGGGGCKRKHED